MRLKILLFIILLLFLSTTVYPATKILPTDLQKEGLDYYEAAAGGGDSVTVNSTAVDTTANIKDSTDVTWTLTDGGVGGPDDVEGTVVNDGHTHTSSTLTEEWTDTGTVLHPTELTDDVSLGSATLTNSAKFSIDGDTDQVQTSIQANATQTSDIFVVEKSDGTDYVRVEEDGGLHINHTANVDGDHAFEIDMNAAGYGGVHTLDIVHKTGTMGAGEEEEAILVIIDESGSGGGEVFGLEILATNVGSAVVGGIRIGATIAPYSQLSGTFGDMDSASNDGVNNLAEFIDTENDVEIFVADNDYVIIGDAAVFEEIEFILDTVAQNAGGQPKSIIPTFEYSTGDDTWSAAGAFSPTDTTNGMSNSGVIVWDLATISGSWAVDPTPDPDEYLIRITRTKDSLGTAPKEDIVQISADKLFTIDENGNCLFNSYALEGSTDDANETTITATDPTGDRTITLPDSDQTVGLATTISGAATFVTSNPKKRVYISATAGLVPTTTGCADAAQTELGSTDINRINLMTCDFDASTDEYWIAHFTLPENYDGGTFTAAVSWTCTADAAKGVAWFIQLLGASSGDVMGATNFGTAVEMNDDGETTNDYLLTAESAAITENHAGGSGSSVGGDELWVKLYRDVSDADDDLTTDAKFIGLWLTFGIDALSTED